MGQNLFQLGQFIYGWTVHYDTALHQVSRWGSWIKIHYQGLELMSTQWIKLTALLQRH